MRQAGGAPSRGVLRPAPLPALRLAVQGRLQLRRLGRCLRGRLALLDQRVEHHAEERDGHPCRPGAAPPRHPGAALRPRSAPCVARRGPHHPPPSRKAKTRGVGHSHRWRGHTDEVGGVEGLVQPHEAKEDHGAGLEVADHLIAAGHRWSGGVLLKEKWVPVGKWGAIAGPPLWPPWPV